MDRDAPLIARAKSRSVSIWCRTGCGRSNRASSTSSSELERFETQICNLALNAKRLAENTPSLSLQNFHLVPIVHKGVLSTFDRCHPVQLSLVLLPQRLQCNNLPLEQLLSLTDPPLRGAGSINPLIC
jgi:hypothetical protein